MKARLVLHIKQIRANETVEIEIWRVAESKDRPHGVKFSVVYIRDGERLLGYDNAEGKGYHKHTGDRTEPYRFVSIWKLITDFRNDLMRIRGREWNED